MKTKIKRLLTAFAATAIAAAIPFSSSALPDASPHGWYFKKVEGGARPTLPKDLSFAGKYDLKWLGDDNREKVIYLTFDAGYENGNISKVLDTLAEYGAQGTFFILENLVKRNPDIVMRMYNEGHTIGNHTTKHADMTSIEDRALFAKQVTGLEEYCFENLGIEISKYFRPPEGRISERELEYLSVLGEKTVMWSFAYADWDNSHQPDEKRAIDNIISHTHNGMVILLHPTSATNAAILPTLIEKWLASGYRFGSMDELFGVK